MVLSGEQHSESSRQLLKEAHEELAALKKNTTDALHALRREFGWLNFEPRGLCICHLLKEGPEYDNPDNYTPPADADHHPECDGYNKAVELLRKIK